MDPKSLGFKVIKFLDLPRFKVLEVDSKLPFSSQLYCPADGISLKTFATLVGEEGHQKIRIGYCASCGYLGYIDRPTKEWIEKFYLETWRQKEKRNTQTNPDLRRKKELETFLSRFGFDKNLPVLEIGSGTGENLKQIKDLGFKKLIGIENSKHRAQRAREAYGLEILTGPFESKEIQAQLPKLPPVGLIISHHVLEHTYDPDEIIKLCAELQESGDYLIFSLPNLLEEPSYSCLLYFPHLHSFAEFSFQTLLSKNNYLVVGDSLGRKDELYSIARKVDQKPILEPPALSHFDEILRKFVKGLGLGKEYRNKIHTLRCYRDIDRRSSGLERLFARKEMVSLVVKNLEKRFTSYSDSPLEIQFNGKIKLLYK